MVMVHSSGGHGYGPRWWSWLWCIVVVVMVMVMATVTVTVTLKLTLIDTAQKIVKCVSLFCTQYCIGKIQYYMVV